MLCPSSDAGGSLYEPDMSLKPFEHQPLNACATDEGNEALRKTSGKSEFLELVCICSSHPPQLEERNGSLSLPYLKSNTSNLVTKPGLNLKKPNEQDTVDLNPGSLDSEEKKGSCISGCK